MWGSALVRGGRTRRPRSGRMVSARSAWRVVAACNPLQQRLDTIYQESSMSHRVRASLNSSGFAVAGGGKWRTDGDAKERLGRGANMICSEASLTKSCDRRSLLCYSAGLAASAALDDVDEWSPAVVQRRSPTCQSPCKLQSGIILIFSSIVTPVLTPTVSMKALEYVKRHHRRAALPTRRSISTRHALFVLWLLSPWAVCVRKDVGGAGDVTHHQSNDLLKVSTRVRSHGGRQAVKTTTPMIPYHQWTQRS